MPFLEILWDAAVVGEQQVAEVRDVLVAELGPALMAVDPGHVVNAAMVDARVLAMGPLDRVRSPIFVTALARHEAGRSAGAGLVVDRLRTAVAAVGHPHDVVVELVLTDHHSSVDYAALE